MPQASDECRRKYKELFPDIGCEHGIKYLQDKGFILRHDYLWIPPDRPLDPDELFIIGFLIDEWDFGGLVIKEEEEGHDLSIHRCTA